MATITNIVDGASSSSTNTLATLMGVYADVGDFLVIAIAASNDGTNGAAPGISSISGNGNNTVDLRNTKLYDPGAAGEGCVLYLLTCSVTEAIDNSVFTFTFDTNVSQKAVVIKKVVPDSGKFIAYSTVYSGTWGSSTTIAYGGFSISSGKILIGAASIETNGAITADSDTTNGSWDTQYLKLADAGLPTTAMTVVMQAKVVTGTGNQTYNVSSSVARDYAINLLTLDELSHQTITGTKYTNTNTFGSHTLANRQILTATKLTDGDAFAGAHSLVRNLTATSFTNSQSFGTHVILASQALDVTSLSDGDSFGAHVILADTDITATVVTDSDTFGTHSTQSEYDLITTVLSDSESFGAHEVLNTAILTHTRLALVNTFGTHTTEPVYNLTTAIINDADSFGTPTAESVNVLLPGLFSDGDTLGGDTILPEYNVTASLVTGDDIFPSPVVLSVYTLTSTLFASSNSFGSVTFTTSYTATASHVSDSDSFGTHTLVPGPVTLTATPLVLTNSFGTHTVVPGAVTLTATAVSDADNFGSHTVLPGAVTLTATHETDPDWHGTHTAQSVYTATASILSDGDTFGTHSLVRMVTALPLADVSDGSWTNQAGSNVDLYDSINETTYSDTDYIQSVHLEIGQEDTVEIFLSAIGDAGLSTDHNLRYRFDKEGDQTISLTVSLVQGATVIASWTHNNVSDPYVDAVQELTTVQADSITDYADLRLRFRAAA